MSRQFIKTLCEKVCAVWDTIQIGRFKGKDKWLDEQAESILKSEYAMPLMSHGSVSVGLSVNKSNPRDRVITRQAMTPPKPLPSNDSGLLRKLNPCNVDPGM